MIRIAIVGSRSFTNYPFLHRSMFDAFAKESIILTKQNITINSGRAKGADTLGERFASQYNIPVAYFKPDWSTGKSAGIKRNIQMSNESDIIVAFWDGISTGTKHMIEYSLSKGKAVHVYYY